MLNLSLELPELQKAVYTYVKGDDRIHLFPTFHDEIGFSIRVRDVFDEVKPNLVMLELPTELEDGLRVAIQRLPAFTLLHENKIDAEQHLPKDTRSYIIHPADAIYWSGYLARSKGIKIRFIDKLMEMKIDSISAGISYHHLASIGWDRFWKESNRVIPDHIGNERNVSRTKHIITKLLDAPSDNILAVIGAAHWPFIHEILIFNNYTCDTHPFSEIEIPILENAISTSQNKIKWYLSDIHPHTIHLTTHALPYFISSMVSNELDNKSTHLLETTRELFFTAEKSYRDKFDDTISMGNYVRLFQYLRNLSRVHGRIIPNLYDIIHAAKGMGDDDYAYEVFKIAILYRFPPEEPLDNQVKFSPDQSTGELIRFAFKRRYKRPILKYSEDDDFDPIPSEEFPGEWKSIWDKYSPEGYVSYPPEDEFLEQYLRTIERKLEAILREENAQSIEFRGSIEDGIDLRETIAHHHEKKLFVKKFPKNIKGIGSIILQFQEDPIDEEYNYYSTLYAEHEKESHLSILTTPVAHEFVGPGICRVKYAALISQYPPIGYPVRIPISGGDLKMRLIYAAMSMSLTNIIGYVAKKPPSAAHRNFASQYGFRILFIPMIQLSKSSMNRLRTMHLLANRSFRDVARDYIGF